MEFFLRSVDIICSFRWGVKFHWFLHLVERVKDLVGVGLGFEAGQVGCVCGELFGFVFGNEAQLKQEVRTFLVAVEGQHRVRVNKLDVVALSSAQISCQHFDVADLFAANLAAVSLPVVLDLAKLDLQVDTKRFSSKHLEE